MKKNIILVVVILIMIPIVVLSFTLKTKYFFANEEKAKTPDKKQVMVRLNTNNKISEMTLENYVVGVVSCEMPALFHEEALKAQAVASRTYALKKIKENKNYVLDDSTNDQCYLTKEEMKEKWKAEYSKFYNKIKEAVTQTKGEYLTYNDEIITAFYFSMSNGYTEESELVFKENLPYIKSVSSNWETKHRNYITKVTFTEKEIIQKLNLKEKNVNKIEVINKTNTGRVNNIKVNNTVFLGTQFRKLLDLKSADFNIKIEGNQIIITTKGNGHGVGMSQYGANGLANENKDYKAILKYYYENVEISV